MFRFLVIGLMAISPARAEWIDLPWPALGTDLPIWKPNDFDSSKAYPALIFYHGTNGKPNASFLHRITEGRDFVLVGMTYRKSGRYDYSDESIAHTLGLLNALKKTLVGSLSVDPERIHVGGMSKGGWVSAMLLDRDPSLAGGVILGAGVFEPLSEAGGFTSQKPIYIGCGRYDGNYPQALAALLHFRDRGAAVTLDPWPDTGHAYPENPPEPLRQWLRIQADPDELKDEATRWLDERLDEIGGIDDPVDQWFACESFQRLPFAKLIGTNVTQRATALAERLLEDPQVATEKKWRDASRRILAKECQDRLLTTLQSASAAYAELADKARGTRAGRDAEKDLERTRNLLENARVVERPTATPDSSSEATDTAPPTGSPDRGPFFHPGFKVKPAE